MTNHFAVHFHAARFDYAIKLKFDDPAFVNGLAV